MKQVVVEEQSGEEPPKFPFVDHCDEIERAEAMQRGWIGQCASPEFNAKGRDVEQDKNNYDPSIS